MREEPSGPARSVAVALMRASPPGTPPTARAVATAVLSALRALAAVSPVVIAIDDAQWLDRASTEALAFALRRLGVHRVGVAAAVRVGNGAAADPPALALAFADRVARLASPVAVAG